MFQTKFVDKIKTPVYVR